MVQRHEADRMETLGRRLMMLTIHVENRVPSNTLETSYKELREQGRQALSAGRLEEALELLHQALVLARRSDDADLIDRAFCNHCALTIALGRFDDFQSLREVLVRNQSGETSFAAAYNLSRAYELTRNFKKALFYGRVARDRSTPLENPEFLAKSHVQIGKCLVAGSHFDDAVAEFESALALIPETMSTIRASTLVNLAYPQILLGKTREAFRNLFMSLRWYRKAGQRIYEAWPHLTLCFAYSEAGRLDLAARHGERALVLAEETGDMDALKNSYFLLGELEKSRGDYEAAHGHYSRLQERFYPDNPQVPQLMLMVDTRELVNMRA